MSAPARRGLWANMASWVFKTSLAASAEETTTVETSPTWRNINGPYLCDSSLKRRWGRDPPRWWTLPIIGSLHGPGGSFDNFLPLMLLLKLFTSFSEIMRMEIELKRKGKQKKWRSIIKIQSYGWINQRFMINIYTSLILYVWMLPLPDNWWIDGQLSHVDRDLIVLRKKSTSSCRHNNWVKSQNQGFIYIYIYH